MNKKNIIRKVIVLVGCSLMILAALYPPYKKTLQASQRQQEIPIGFYFVFNPPEQIPFQEPAADSYMAAYGNRYAAELFGPDPPPDKNLVERHYSIHIDFHRLLLLWFSIVVFTGLCLFLIHETTQKKEVQP